MAILSSLINCAALLYSYVASATSIYMQLQTVAI